MADDNERIGKTLDCAQRGLDALVERRRRIVERQVGCDDVVAGGAQGLGHRVPARAVVPCAVDQAEGRHARSTVTVALTKPTGFSTATANASLTSSSAKRWVTRSSSASRPEVSRRMPARIPPM